MTSRGCCSVYETFCKIKPSAYVLTRVAYTVNKARFMCVACDVLFRCSLSAHVTRSFPTETRERLR